MKRVFFFLIIFFNLNSLKSEEIANSIAKAVEGAETMAGFPINKVTCSLSGGRPITKVTRNELKIENGQVMKSDLAKIEKMNKPKTIENYKIQSVMLYQAFWQRRFNLGSIIFLTAGGMSYITTCNYEVLKKITNNVIYNVESS